MDEYYKNLPKKRMAAGALIFNEQDELLIVKTRIKDYWSIPGGVVHENESPKDACIREVKEEIGITLADLELACVDYTSSNEKKDESIQFAFWGGTLSPKEVEKIHIDEKELEAYQFVSREKALPLLGPTHTNLGKRLSTLLGAEKRGGMYLENGE